MQDSFNSYILNMTGEGKDVKVKVTLSGHEGPERV
jgi:hypothetical protein